MASERWEEVVYSPHQDVLIGWWNWTECGVGDLLVFALLPTLARLRARGEAGGLRCCLYVEAVRGQTLPPNLFHLVDCEWLEVTMRLTRPRWARSWRRRAASRWPRQGRGRRSQ